MASPAKSGTQSATNSPLKAASAADGVGGSGDFSRPSPEAARLRAEVAALRAGQAQQQRVAAALQAEVDRLRASVSAPALRSAAEAAAAAEEAETERAPAASAARGAGMGLLHPLSLGLGTVLGLVIGALAAAQPWHSRAASSSRPHAAAADAAARRGRA